jgi:NADPH:quinone reductase-like Zn-dependent oxidoreductase
MASTPTPAANITIPKTMLAAVLESRGRDGLKLREVPVPRPGPGEVLVRVAASGLNRVDLYMRDNGQGITHTLPQIQGVEASGRVALANPEDPELPVGAKVIFFTSIFCGQCRFCVAGNHPLCVRPRIMGEHRDGAWAQFVVMPRKCVVPLPPDADLVECGALAVAHGTAWRMVFGKRALQPDETVLVVGIGSGVSLACLQLARLIGARVIVTSSSDDKLARAMKMGACAGIHYKREKVAQRVLELTGGEGVDMVLENSGEASWSDSLRSLRRGGRLVTCGATTGSQPGADLQRLFIRQLEIYGSTGASVGEFRSMLKVYFNSGFKPLIDSRYPLERIGEALDRLSAFEQFGKVVVTMDEMGEA